MIPQGYIGKTSNMRFVSNIARAAKIAALIHICVLFMGGTVAQAQQLPYGEWVETPNTTLSDNVAGCLHAWAGAAYDPVNHEFIHPNVGGHGCASATNDGDSYAVDLDTALMGGEGWRQVEPHIPASPVMWPGYTGSNCFLQQSDGSIHPPEVHTYGGPTYLGDGKILFLGAFMICVGTPDQVAALVDTTTTPWTWTHLPHLLPYAHTTAATLSGQHVYIVHRDGGWAKVDKDTLAIVASGTIGPVKHLNVNMPSSSAFVSGASMGAGGVNADGFFCTRINSAITCFNTNGGVSDAIINGQLVVGANDDRFGKGIRRSVPSECQVSGSSMTPIPGGEFAMWGGGKRLCTFKPDPEPFLAASDGHVCSTAELQANCGYDGDTWRVIDPPTGPAVNKVYNKLAWYEPGQFLVGYGPSNLWAINPLEGPPPPTNTAPVANDDAFVGAEETILAGNVLTNDTDAEGAITVTANTSPASGVLVVNLDGSFTYEPEPDFFGVVTFDYTASDGELTDTATVTLTVLDVAEPMDRLVCTVDPIEFPAGETPEAFDLVQHCAYQRAEIILPPPPPPPPDTAESYSTPTFAARSAGAIFSNAFDVQPPSGTTGNQHAVTVNTGNTNWVRPHVVRSEDGQGALQFDLLPLSSSGASGAYVFKFTQNPCGLGETCYLSWRMEFNEAFVDTQFKRYDNGGNTAPKLIIVSQSSSSNQPNEIVVTSTTGSIKAPTMYHNGNHFIQIPRVTLWQYPKNQWVTFNLTITKPAAGYLVGTRTWYDVGVRLQAKPDGGEVVTIVDSVEPMLSQALIMDGAYITTYTTKKDYEQDHPHAFVRLDEVIYRKDAPIAFP
jgi:hypothetical protein